MAQGLPKELPWQNISMQELILVKTNIAGYFFDGFLDVNHQISTTLTTHQVQKGSSLTDHAYLEPVELTMTVKMSDAMSGMVESQFKGISYTRSTAAYKILRELQKQRVAFQVHTRLETYQNMMITSLSVDDDYTNYTGLLCTVSLKEVLVAKETTVKISKRQQTTASYNNGTISTSSQTLLDSNSTLLYNIASRYGYTG